MEEFQFWYCRCGCGEKFYTSTIFTKKKPPCPNCNTNEGVEKGDIYFLKPIVKDAWGYYKAKIGER